MNRHRLKCQRDNDVASGVMISASTSPAEQSSGSVYGKLIEVIHRVVLLETFLPERSLQVLRLSLLDMIVRKGIEKVTDQPDRDQEYYSRILNICPILRHIHITPQESAECEESPHESHAPACPD